jgi:hypothetical protein
MDERQKRESLTKLAGMAHDRELELYLSELEDRFREWRQGAISSTELSDFIHDFHDGAARGIYSTYTQMKRDEAVARAIGVGLLGEDEVPSEITQALATTISHFRHTYQIDDRDPLARHRSQTRLSGRERDAEE